MPAKTLMSIAEFERLPEPAEGGGYELDEGEPIYVSPNSLEQSEIIYRIYAKLKQWADSTGAGLIAADTWFDLAPGIIRAPDVAFIPASRASNLDPKHALKVVPALAVEVLSPQNRAREVSRKIQQYRDAGVEVIWVVDPEKKEIDFYSSKPLRTLREQDVLEDSELLPGFSALVTSIF